MTKETILSVVRTLLTLLGAYIVGHNFFGGTVLVDNALLDNIIGAVIGLGSAIWGIFDKSSGVDQLQSGLRSFITVIGGVLTAGGKISGTTLNLILGLIAPLLTIIQSFTAKQKIISIATGTLSPTLSGKTVTNVPPKGPDANTAPSPK